MPATPVPNPRTPLVVWTIPPISQPCFMDVINDHQDVSSSVRRGRHNAVEERLYDCDHVAIRASGTDVRPNSSKLERCRRRMERDESPLAVLSRDFLPP